MLSMLLIYMKMYKFFFENKIKNFADKQNEYNNKYLKVYYNLNKKFHLVISELTILSVLIQILNASITTVYIINNKLPISAFSLFVHSVHIFVTP